MIEAMAWARVGVCGAWIGLALALAGCPAAQPKATGAVPAEGASKGDERSCAASAVRDLDVDREVQAINAIKGAGEGHEDWEAAPEMKRGVDYARHFKALGLTELAEAIGTAIPASWGELYTCKAEVRPFEVVRGSGDRLVTVDCQNHAYDFSGEEHFAARLLRPLGKGLQCDLGGFQGARQTSDRPCLTAVPGDVPWAFEPVELVAPGTFAVQLTYYGGHCADVERGDKINREFWGWEAGGLRMYASGSLANSDYQSPCPPTTWREGAFVLGPSFPKTLTYTEAQRCIDPNLRECAAPEPCSEHTRSTVFSYQHGAYVDASGAPTP